jgi:hypothetical protein
MQPTIKLTCELSRKVSCFNTTIPASVKSRRLRIAVNAADHGISSLRSLTPRTVWRNDAVSTMEIVKGRGTPNQRINGVANRP